MTSQPQLQLILATGPETPERAVLALGAALSAAHSGTQVSVVLAMRGAAWASPLVGDDNTLEGYPTVASLIAEVLDAGAEVLGCSSCIDRFCPAPLGADGQKVLRAGIARVGLSLVAMRMTERATVTF
ncbi:MAG: DsrE family protein [Myxococcales bacterium]|nr:DsrE family protein [Myxococcales bacterium]